MPINFDKIPFVPAKNYTSVSLSKPRNIKYIVLHTMEAPEKTTTAEAVANYFKNSGVRASAHYCVDNNSIVQCVQCKDVAWAAPGANSTGIQIEMAGYAGQTSVQWDDEYSKALLENVAQLCAKILVPKFHIPIQYVSFMELKGQKKGFTTHKNVSLAFKKSTHWDPGPNFPMAKLLARCREIYS